MLFRCDAESVFATSYIPIFMSGKRKYTEKNLGFGSNEAERVVEFSSNPHRVMNVIFCFVFCLQEANTHSLIEDIRHHTGYNFLTKHYAL
jgi:hypothetical protein